MSFDLLSHLYRQLDFSVNTFGPHFRPKAILKHLKQELKEIKKKPHDLEEWIDVVILGLHGAMKSGATPAEVISMLEYKQTKNENRQWPDWRTLDDNRPSNHIEE